MGEREDLTDEQKHFSHSPDCVQLPVGGANEKLGSESIITIIKPTQLGLLVNPQPFFASQNTS